MLLAEDHWLGLTEGFWLGVAEGFRLYLADNCWSCAGKGYMEA